MGFRLYCREFGRLRHLYDTPCDDQHPSVYQLAVIYESMWFSLTLRLSLVSGIAQQTVTKGSLRPAYTSITRLV